MSNIVFLIGIALAVEAITGEKMADKIGAWGVARALLLAVVLDFARAYAWVRTQASKERA